VTGRLDCDRGGRLVLVVTTLDDHADNKEHRAEYEHDGDDPAEPL